jgi:hypothetical protein
MAVELMYEYGMLYTINLDSYHKNAPHLEPSWYTFRGNMSLFISPTSVDITDELLFVLTLDRERSWRMGSEAVR